MIDAERTAAAMFPDEPHKQPGAAVIIQAIQDEAQKEINAACDKCNKLLAAMRRETHPPQVPAG